MEGQSKKLHLGCCLNTPEGWINVDGSFNGLLAKYPFVKKTLAFVGVIPKSKLLTPWSKNLLIHDVRKPLPFATNSMQAVYASHLLEHIYLDQAEKLLAESFRVLKPGGVARFMVPDLYDFAILYLQQKENGTAGPGKYPGDVFMENLLLRSSKAPKGNWAYRMYDTLKDFHSHKWMYDEESLKARFEKAGFVEVSKKPLHESRIEDIKVIEQNQGLCIEGVKPA